MIGNHLLFAFLTFVPKSQTPPNDRYWRIADIWAERSQLGMQRKESFCISACFIGVIQPHLVSVFRKDDAPIVRQKASQFGIDKPEEWVRISARHNENREPYAMYIGGIQRREKRATGHHDFPLVGIF